MKKSFAVLGLGRFGRTIAMELYAQGAEVMVIDHDDEKINRVADDVTCAMNVDVCDVDALKNAGISNMDAVVVAMADCIEPSIMSIMTAKELGVPIVIAKARDEVTGGIFGKVGADRVVFPERESGLRLSRRLMSDDFLDYFDLSDKVSMIEILPKREWVGRSLKELNLRKEYKINVIGIREQEDINVTLDPDEPIREGCALLVIVSKTNLKRLM